MYPLPAFRPGTRQALLRTLLRKGGPLRLLLLALPVVPLRLPGLRGCRRHLPPGRSLPDFRSPKPLPLVPLRLPAARPLPEPPQMRGPPCGG